MGGSGFASAGAIAKGVSTMVAGGAIASPTAAGGAGFSLPTTGVTGFVSMGVCGTALLQAYSANKVESQIESMRSTRCITNIRKSWKLHYM
jgi:hypothetical protein